LVHDRPAVWKHLEDLMVARWLLKPGRNLDWSMTGMVEEKMSQSAAEQGLGAESGIGW
jgi:hypothetical protein